MSATPVYLLPPSEGKLSGGREGRGRGRFDDSLGVPRRHILMSLAQLFEQCDETECSRVMGVRGTLFDVAHEAMRELINGKERSLPAWRRYHGVVWQHLDPETLTRSQRGRILVPSGLYGLTTANDAIADYRLKMNVRLDPLGMLSLYWRPYVTALLRDLPRETAVINALPREHAAACDFAEIARRHRVIHLDFVTRTRVRAAGHAAKAAKGTLVRFILEHGVEAARLWRWEGWRVYESESGLEVVAP